MGLDGRGWLHLFDTRDRTLPMLGDISAATGTRHIVWAWDWANMRGSAGAQVAATARDVIDALHAQDGNREVIFSTSIDDGSPAGVTSRASRADHNGYWADAVHRTGIAGYVPLHLDADVGVQRSAPTDGNAGTYSKADNEHLTATGYALTDVGPHGFRAAVQAQLAA